MTGIIDYGMGNLMSVQKAFAYLNIPARVTDKPDVVLECDKVVLPGVGAFGDAMAVLRETGMYDAIRQMADAGKPLLGICLGMQLLFDRSYEGGEFAGLGLLPGEITRLNAEDPAYAKDPAYAEDPAYAKDPAHAEDPTHAKNTAKSLFGRGGLKIPHMGWNSLDIKKASPLFVGLINTNRHTYVYFDHAYCFAVNGDKRYAVNDDIIAATSEYGITFAAAAQRDNIFALQFHPEKSGETGLAMLRNFAEL